MNRFPVAKWQRRGLLAAGGGLLAAIAFPPVGAYPLVFVGAALLAYAVLSSETLGAAARSGFAWGFLFYGTLVAWLGNLRGIVWLPAALAAYEGALVALAAAAAWTLARGTHGWARGIALASALFVGEWARGVGQFGFPWGTLSVALAGSQLAGALALYGHEGASLLVWAFGAFAAAALVEARGRVARWLAAAVVVAVASAALATTALKPEVVGTVRVAVVSENLTPDEKHSPDMLERETVYVPRFERLLDEALASSPGVVVFPESSFPGDLARSPDWFERFRAASLGGPVILVGSAVAEGARDYNRLYVFDRGSVRAYDKRSLVPFGEYLPFPRVLGFARGLGAVTEFTRGTRSPVIETSAGTIGVGICWESALPGAGPALARRGARMLVFATNDNWFGRSAQADQHWQWTISQSDASGLAVVQAANAGRSGIYVDGRARVLPSWSRGVIVARAPLRRPNRIAAAFQRAAVAAARFLSLAALAWFAARSALATLPSAR